MKKVSTSSGMESISTSPLLQRRLSNVQQRIQRVRKALDTKNFILLGETIEEDCLEMHRVMQTQTPPLMYWTEMTKSIMEKVYEWRKSGIPVYFTIDAGPNVHLIFERKDESRILSCINEMKGIETCIMNYVSEGTTYTQDHLF
jgi:diphosphomevalonate decarboxylase